MKPIKPVIFPFFIVLILILAISTYFLGEELTSKNVKPTDKNNKEYSQRNPTANLISPDFVGLTPSSLLEAKPAKTSEEEQSNSKVTYELYIAVSSVALAAITLALAVFTFLLWLSTRSLSKEAIKTSSRQYREMKESLDIAKESITLTRNGFFATHRPKIIAHAFEHDVDDQGEIRPILTYVNTGSSSATVTMISATIILTDKLRTGTQMSGKCLDVVINPGEFKTFTVQSGIPNNSFVVENIKKGRSQGDVSNIYICVGEIYYRDNTGTNRVTGFCRKFDNAAGSWVIFEATNYEYSY